MNKFIINTMKRLIKALADNRSVVFDSGKFDDWCVYVVESNGQRRPPFDNEYFAELKRIATRYEEDKVYNDFVRIYDITGKGIDVTVLKAIDEITSSYEDADKNIIEQWLTVLYGGMIAEENKQFAILKKRVKRLGMHQTLKLGFDPNTSANFSKGKKWQELDAIMKKLGF